MNTINQTENGCYLLNENAFRIRLETTFNKKVLQGPSIKIDGIYTYSDKSFTLDYKKNKIYNARNNGTAFYDYRNMTILIDGIFLKGQFIDMYNNRIRYYINSKGFQSMIIAALVTLEDHDVLDIIFTRYTKLLYSNSAGLYTLVTNVILPNMDIISPKLVSY